jgi:transcriptional regulator with XRE-family HTH domain
MADIQFDAQRFARLVKKNRERLGLTQQELAELLYCDIRQIRRYETNGTERLSVINLYASVFNISALGILTASAKGAF